MKGNTRTSALGLLALAYRASAQVASICPSEGVCFGLNIPENTASSGSGDIFFQISAPSDYEWVALGQGRGMDGANMFVVYTSEGGSNVTLSPRSASGHGMPTSNGDAQVELLEGSGVTGGVMTANVKCSNCDSWSGGTMDFTAGNGDWIYGYKSSGGPMDSNDQSARIDQHDGKSSFTWDFANAKGGDSVNPLVSASPTGTGSGGSASCIPRPASATGTAASATQSSGSTNDDDDDDDDGVDDDDDDDDDSFWTGRPTARPTSRPYGPPQSKKRQESLPYCDEVNSGSGITGSNAGFTPINSGGPFGEGNGRTMLIAHGVLASLAFVILFPSGAIAMRLASVPGIVWIHAGFQIFAYFVYIAAFGLGVYLASSLNMLDHHHPVIGIVVLVLLFFQPALGWMHHLMFKKYSHRTFWSYAHLWLGRSVVTLGIINGGLGLKWADSMGMSSKGGMIAYGVIAGLVWLVWVAAIVVGERRRKRAQGNRLHKDAERRESDRSDSDGVAGHYAPKGQ